MTSRGRLVMIRSHTRGVITMSLRDLFPDTSHLDVADPDTLTEPPDELPPDPDAPAEDPEPIDLRTLGKDDPLPPTPMERAEAGKAEGMARVEEAAGETWNARATSWLKGWLRTHPEYNPDTDNVNGPEPKERRAWGPVTSRAIREGWLKRTGYAPRTNGRCAPGPVYKSLIFRSR